MTLLMSQRPPPLIYSNNKKSVEQKAIHIANYICCLDDKCIIYVLTYQKANTRQMLTMYFPTSEVI